MTDTYRPAADETVTLDSAVDAAFADLEADPVESTDVEVEEAASQSSEAEAEDTDETAESETEVEGDEPEIEEEPEPEATDEDKFLVVIDGQEVEVTLDEALKGYQRQADYTRKTQALAEESKRVAAVAGLMDRLQADPQGTLQALAQHVGIALPSGTQEAVDLDSLDPMERKVYELEQRLAQQDSFRAEQERLAMQAQIDRDISDIKQRYEDTALDPEDLLRYAVDHQIIDLESAYKAFAYERNLKTAADKRAAERNEKVTKKRKASVVASGKSPRRTSVDKGQSSKPTLDEILNSLV